MIIEHFYNLINFGLVDLNITYDINETKEPLIDTIYYTIKTSEYESNTTVHCDLQIFSCNVNTMRDKINEVGGIEHDPLTHTFNNSKLGRIMIEIATQDDLNKFISLENSNIEKIQSIISAANN